MTNHGETTGTPESHGTAETAASDSEVPTTPASDKATGSSPRKTVGARDERLGQAEGVDSLAYDGHGDEQVTLRTPAELADALPYLLGYRPEDSIVLVALRDKDGRGRFGGRARLGIPANTDDWPAAARQLAHGLVTGSERRGARPDQMVAYLCQEPGRGESGRDVMERLRPLVQQLRVECGSRDVPVIEALCISDGRFWSYCCVSEACCPPEGQSMGLPGTSVLAAAATYAGLQVRGTLRELRARLMPWENAAALAQEIALDTAGMAIVPRILDEAGRAGVAAETLELAEQIMRRFEQAPSVSGILTADLRDDQLLGHDEAASLILGLQDRTTRDRAAEWMEGDAAGPALRLWRALARRCVGPYGEHAAAPLTLAGWVAWSTGDQLEAREALAMALGADPDYLFARLLHQACNEGLDPESIRRCLRAERGDRGQTEPVGAGDSAVGVGRADLPNLPDLPDLPDRSDAGSMAADEDAVGSGEASSVSLAAPAVGSGRRRRTRSADAGASGARSAKGEREGRGSGVGSRSRAAAGGGARPGAARPSAGGSRPDSARGGRTRKGVDGSGRGLRGGGARSGGVGDAGTT
ncbi:DUF4192 domain-containing protein [Streptomyces justiciae]|uniref:DUF4192 domain-containing protein n=1 Tax=Streptomyces justiciae TaxID=2780140 RepID=UPI001882191D|nr:DUF4192 domain-containing protein [Streptomyces justiciae]MBE8473625.1 DUF4192 domain-containing protein [Streptomyces justiciae]